MKRCLLSAAVAVVAMIGGLHFCEPMKSLVTAAQAIESTSAADAARAINAYRRSRGRGRVTVNNKLNRAAEAYARKLAGVDRITHKLKGSTLPKRLAAVGYDWGSAAENLGAGYKNLDHAIKGWRTSKKGHNAILLKREAQEMGFALATRDEGRYKTFWVLIMARKREEGESLRYKEKPH